MYNILVCDDEKDIVSALKIYLEAEGCAVFTASNGREALELLRRETIHLVLLDVMMPELDGISALESILAVKPSAKASPAVTAESEKDLPEVIASFPAPVMNFMSGSGMTFVSASSADAALNGGFGRIATLNWQTPEGEPVMLRSIWPADALSLLEAGYHFMPYAGPTLFGNASVRMENDDAVRIHTATDRALYVVLLPRSLSGQAGTLCRSLQLFTVGE